MGQGFIPVAKIVGEWTLFGSLTHQYGDDIMYKITTRFLKRAANSWWEEFDKIIKAEIVKE